MRGVCTPLILFVRFLISYPTLHTKCWFCIHPYMLIVDDSHWFYIYFLPSHNWFVVHTLSSIPCHQWFHNHLNLSLRHSSLYQLIIGMLYDFILVYDVILLRSYKCFISIYTYSLLMPFPSIPTHGVHNNATEFVHCARFTLREETWSQILPKGRRPEARDQIIVLLQLIHTNSFIYIHLYQLIYLPHIIHTKSSFISYPSISDHHWPGRLILLPVWWGKYLCQYDEVDQYHWQYGEVD